MDDVLLSIIIPCYNSGEFLEKTIQMLLAQDLKDCELIFVNDGSEDNTLSIINSYVEKYSFINVYNQQNRGVSVARNNGLKHARGEYVYFFDSDDSLIDDTIKYYKDKLQEMPNVDMFSYGYQLEENKKVVKKYITERCSQQINEGTIFLSHLLVSGIHFHICSCIFKKDFLKKNSIEFVIGQRFGEDSEFIRNALCLAGSVYYDARIGFRYILRNESATKGNTYNSNSFESFVFTVSRMEKLYEFMDEKVVNYYLATRYARQVTMYLRSNIKDEVISTGLRKYRYLLFQEISYEKNSLTLAILLLRVFPISIMLFLLKK